MPDEIAPLPRIPEGLRTAATHGSLIPFIGAGFSKLGGCPDWKEFANRVLHHFVERGKIDYLYLEQISNLSPRVKLSLAKGMAAEHGMAIDYAALLRPSGDAAFARGRRAYDALSKLAKVFVTTNYDEWLDTVGPQSSAVGEQDTSASAPPTIRRNVYYNVDDLKYDRLDTPNTVLHIHGSMNDPDSMILTTSDYLNRYANHQVGGAPRENRYLAFLESLFRNKNVLFIGYGLEELEILEYVVQKARDARNVAGPVQGRREEPRHFMLQGFYSHQGKLAASLERYFADEIGVQLLPFSRDKKDWEQLIDVIEHLGQQIPVGSSLSLQNRSELRNLLDE